MNIWEAAAGYLVRAPVTVRVAHLPGRLRGLACMEGSRRVIELSPDLDNNDKLNCFLHEVGHHRYHDLPQKPEPEEFEKIAGYLQTPGVTTAYKATDDELRADGFAFAAREWIDEVTWPHAMDLTLKLKVWLESTTR